MGNVRYNISPCSSAEAAEFIDKVDKSLYSPRGTVRADEHSHYDRYSFVRSDSKVAIVYDTSACVISITAPQAYADELLAVFSPSGKSVKRSTVPAQNPVRHDRPQQGRDVSIAIDGSAPDTRAKIFVSPESIRCRPNTKPTTVLATSKGLEISTDEIFPPQRAKRKSVSDGVEELLNGGLVPPDKRSSYRATGNTSRENTGFKKATSVEEYFANGNTAGVAPIKRPVGRPRKATISFGDDEDDSVKADVKPAIHRSGTGLYADLATHKQELPPVVAVDKPAAKKRGRPRKELANADIVQPPMLRDSQQAVPEYKNGYCVRNFPENKLTALLKRLKAGDYTVKSDGTEFAGAPQEVKSYTVTDKVGSKAFLRYATNKMTIQLQGKRSELFGELQSQIGSDSDYSSALEGYIESGNAGKKNKVSDVESRLKKRLPTAYEFLSEQSRIDFSYGIHDFSRDEIVLSDYSVLLVPPFRGLERFIFDLQRTEGIKVKMIGQAYDKDDKGNYVLKAGYRQKIGSVIYSEVMVALYTEYFSRRNFFAHSDNSEDSRSRAISDRNEAKRIFENLLDIVEYNAKKLKEIGFSVDKV